ncbi:YqhG family protein [Bacillus massilinigeriensis]|uniref:YqhG family protein n=1 Tax=Bacillus mediterraneensis TaxID=1805474 RepID=UPI0008F8CC48|nr:YqhG family protein [Bacillus mediterraneensis]
MQQHEIQDFLLRYFSANSCELEENLSGKITVQLTEEIDRELMNRPFYWHYLEKTGGVAQPMKLTLITDRDAFPEEKGEFIHYGSPRLHQLFSSTKKLAGYIRLYQQNGALPDRQTPLFPWLCINFKISYKCDRKRDVYQSIGLQLINGRMVQGFHEKMLSLSLTPKIPDYSFTLSPLILPKSGMMRIQKQLTESIEKEDHSWAEAARKRWQKDLDLLLHFYEGREGTETGIENEKEALKEQYEPKVLISVINGGLFYLTENAVK